VGTPWRAFLHDFARYPYRLKMAQQAENVEEEDDDE
jgi:hypothetical protein